MQERADALQRAKNWIMQTALPNVPDEFKDSFLNRNPINRAVLQADPKNSKLLSATF